MAQFRRYGLVSRKGVMPFTRLPFPCKAISAFTFTILFHGHPFLAPLSSFLMLSRSLMGERALRNERVKLEPLTLLIPHAISPTTPGMLTAHA